LYEKGKTVYFPYICIALRCFKYARARMGRRKETGRLWNRIYIVTGVHVCVFDVCVWNVYGNSSYVITTTHCGANYSFFSTIPIGFTANAVVVGRLIEIGSPRKQSYAVYVMSVCAADMLVCVCEIPQLVIFIDYIWHFMPHYFPLSPGVSGLLCPVTYEAKYISWFVSSWSVIAMSMERYIAVRYPLRVAAVSSPTKAHCLVCVLVLLSLPMTVPFGQYILTGFYNYAIPQIPYLSFTLNCLFVPSNVVSSTSAIVADFLCTLLPTSILVALSIMLLRAARVALAQNLGSAQGEKKARKLQRRILSTVLGICVPFCVMLIPYSFMRVMYFVFLYVIFALPASPYCTYIVISLLVSVTEGIRVLSACTSAFVFIARSGAFRPLRHISTLWCAQVNVGLRCDQQLLAMPLCPSLVCSCTT
jgi:hypothetical protein